MDEIITHILDQTSHTIYQIIMIIVKISHFSSTISHLPSSHFASPLSTRGLQFSKWIDVKPKKSWVLKNPNDMVDCEMDEMVEDETDYLIMTW